MHALDPRLGVHILLSIVLLTRAIRYRNLLRIVRELRIVQLIRCIMLTLSHLGARCKSTRSRELARPLAIKETRACLLIGAKSRTTFLRELHS